MKKMRNPIIILLVVFIVLALIAWKVYPYIVVGIDYLNGEGTTGVENGKSLEEIMEEQVESGKIQSNPKAVKALQNISGDLTKAKDILTTEDQKEVVALAQQGIDSTLNNDDNYLDKLDELVEAYTALPSEEQQDIQLSIGKSINMRDYLTLKEILEEK